MGVRDEATIHWNNRSGVGSEQYSKYLLRYSKSSFVSPSNAVNDIDTVAVAFVNVLNSIGASAVCNDSHSFVCRSS